MTTTNGLDSEPLWLVIEKKILDLGSQDLSGEKLESAVQRLAGALDDGGFNVSKNAGHMLDLRGAMGARVTVGRPLMEDLEKAFAALTLEDVASPYTATVKLIDEVGGDWPALKDSGRRGHVLQIVESTKLDLQVAKAKGLEGDGGLRLLIGEGVAGEVIVERMGIAQEEFDRVMAAVEAEHAERARVAELLQGAEGKSEADKIRHLITSDVSDGLIIEMAEVDQSAIDDVKKAMEEEIAEMERLAEEAAAKKAAAAAGPTLEDIPPDEMLDHIEAIREILGFSDVEAEIRTMCEQSDVPKELVEIAVSEPDRLDELEAQAEG
jgi:hypothetical protein